MDKTISSNRFSFNKLEPVRETMAETLKKMKKITVFIADDYYLIRRAVSDLIAPHRYEIIGEAETFADTLAFCSKHHPAIILLDPSLPSGGPSPITETEMVAQLLKSSPGARIVILSARKGLPAISAAYKAGVAAYVSKRSGPDVILAALAAVAAGGVFYMPGVAEQLASFYAGHTREIDPRGVLTAKELSLFVLLASGKTNEEAARALDLSRHSVANRMVAIRRKLGCTRADFTRVALRSHLIDVEA